MLSGHGAGANQLKEQDHASSGKTTLFNAKKWPQPSWNMREQLPNLIAKERPQRLLSRSITCAGTEMQRSLRAPISEMAVTSLLAKMASNCRFWFSQLSMVSRMRLSPVSLKPASHR